MKVVSKGTVAYVVAFALLLFWAFFVQSDTRRVDGHSMLPTLEGGDLVVIQSVPISDIRVGDIIVYNGLCSASGLSVIHRVVNITYGGLITKGDNNQYPDQSPLATIALSPITQQCLEGKVVFVIPYVELLAYYVDVYGLPQWVNYMPSLLILFVVFISLFGRDEDKGVKSIAPIAEANPSSTLARLRRKAKTAIEVLIVDALLLILTYFIYTDEQWRFHCALGQEAECLVRSSPSYAYSLLTQFFSMRGETMLLTTPPIVDWTQVVVLVLVVVNVAFLLQIYGKTSPNWIAANPSTADSPKIDSSNPAWIA